MMSLLRCERCGAKCDTGVHCDPCGVALLEGILECPDWIKGRGQCSGDRPGETLEETFRRELELLRLSVRRNRELKGFTHE